MIRTFIAVQLPDTIRERLAHQIETLAPRLPTTIRWVAPESLHLTLAFLGPLDDAQIASAEQATATAAREGPPFSLALTHLGTFGSARSPRVIWAGVTGDIAELGNLQGRLASELELRGFPREDRPFSPHLTLARIKEPLLPDIAGALPDLLRSGPTRHATWRVDAVSVMKSELARSGARYTCMRAYPLDGTPRPPDQRG
jgi:2'-5' RNA ligase